MNRQHLGAGRRDAVRVARRRRPPHGGRQLHRLPGPHAPPLVAAVPRRRAGAGALLLLQPLQLRPHRRAALLAQPARRLDRRLRGGGRPLARDPRRVRLPRLLPLRLRLRLARARPRHGARDAAALRRRDRLAGRGRRRDRRVPRALRRGRDGRSRPDAGARGRLARRGLRGRRRRPAARLEPRRPRLPPAGLPARRARGRGAARRRRRPPRWRCSAKGATPSRVARARSSSSRRPRAAASRSPATRRSSTIPTRSPAPGRRSRTRTRARCSSRRPRATSSPTSAAATTSAAARTARSSRGDTEVPLLLVGVEGTAGEHRRRRAARPRPFRRRGARRTRSGRAA